MDAHGIGKARSELTMVGASKWRGLFCLGGMMLSRSDDDCSKGGVTCGYPTMRAVAEQPSQHRSE